MRAKIRICHLKSNKKIHHKNHKRILSKEFQGTAKPLVNPLFVKDLKILLKRENKNYHIKQI